MKNYLGLVLSFFLIFNTCFSQSFRNPLDIPMYLSGSFAELRSNHFHSGIDIKTQGKEGFPVYAVEDGWVSRIKVSPWGFGTALYISHPNGYTSVYAHLSRYNKAISDYVLKQQYKRKSFSVDLYLKKGQISINKSDIVAYTGNSGSSGGPHLHFEVRNTANQKPMNPLSLGFDVKDNLPPVLYKLSVIDNNERSYYQIKKKSKALYTLDTVYVKTDRPRLSILINDFSNGSHNRLGVNNIELYIDDELYYQYSISLFAFSQTRYINSHIDYDTYISEKKRYQKLYVEEGNRLDAYPVYCNKCLFVDKEYAIARVVVDDSQKNRSELSFVIKKNAGSLLDVPEQSGEFFGWNQKNSFINDYFKLLAKAGSFYFDFNFNWKQKSNRNFIGKYVYEIGNKTVPIHQKIDFSLKIPNSFKGDLSKLCLVRIKGKKTPTVDTKVSGNYLIARIRDFGTYGILLDTIPPKILLKSKKPDYKLKAFVFSITDNLSGIDSYSATLNGEWILFKYDPKTSQYYYDRDYRLQKKNTEQILKIFVSDSKGNKATKTIKFKY